MEQLSVSMVKTITWMARRYGETDILEHQWLQAGPNKVVGKHFNTGPFGAASWWASMEDDGAYLYKVDGIIDE